MKRILVFSDTHGILKTARKIINKIPCDMIIHAGDYVRDAIDLKSEFPDKDIRYVQGNGDLFTSAPKDDIIELDGVRIYVVHGHNHRVKYEHYYETLTEAAMENDCQVAVFGHTHNEYVDDSGSVLLLNPGSAGFGSTYGIIEIEDGEPSACVIDDEQW